jgi:hypothetical protein
MPETNTSPQITLTSGLSWFPVCRRPSIAGGSLQSISYDQIPNLSESVTNHHWMIVESLWIS